MYARLNQLAATFRFSSSRLVICVLMLQPFPCLLLTCLYCFVSCCRSVYFTCSIFFCFCLFPPRSSSSHTFRFVHLWEVYIVTTAGAPWGHLMYNNQLVSQSTVILKEGEDKMLRRPRYRVCGGIHVSPGHDCQRS